MMASQPKPVKVTDVNPHLLCVLCGGYYVDATTIIECLHSFCKSCIVRYLETNKYCPICDVQVHKSKPLLNIRSDRTLQAIVYKLVPGLFQRELNCRKEFYKKQSGLNPNDGGEIGQPSDDSPIYSADESILIGVQYVNPNTSDMKVRNKRYLRCPAALTIYHLQKLMRAKFNLSDSQKVEFLHDGDLLPDYLSLMDLAYMYHWKRKRIVELEYRLLECQQKKIKLFHEESKSIPQRNEQTIVEPGKEMNSRDKVVGTEVDTRDKVKGTEVGVKDEVVDKEVNLSNKVTDREVQLQISENGVMSVQSLDFNTSSVNDALVTAEVNKDSVVSDNSLPVKDIQPETMELMKSLEKAVTLDFDASVTTSATESSTVLPVSSNVNNNTEKSTLSENVSPSVDCNTKMEEVKEEITEDKNKISISHDKNYNSLESAIPPVKVPNLNTNTFVSIQKAYPGIVKEATAISNVSKPVKVKELRTDTKEYEATMKRSSEKQEIRSTNTFKYKHLKSPVKPWSPTISRSSIMAMKQAQLASQEKGEPSGKTQSNKAPKFFKMRNVPRFLGNPASGVKPMYQVLPGSELSSQTPQTSAAQTPKQNNEITVMKIDPKTLNPIPVSSSGKSPKSSPANKLPSSFVCNQQKSAENYLLNCRASIRNPVSKSGHFTTKTPGQIRSSLTPNPFILPSPHSPHMMYSGFPRPFPPLDSPGSRLPTDNQIFRAMSMLCSPSGAFHPSLPPSISMLLNPHHPHHRSTQNDKLNLKYTPSDFHKTTPPPPITPSVQRIPPSGPASKHPSPGSHSTSGLEDSNGMITNSQEHLQKKHMKSHIVSKESEGHNSSISGSDDKKNNTVTSPSKCLDPLQRHLSKSSVPLSNGLSVALSSCHGDVASKTSSRSVDVTNAFNKDSVDKSSNEQRTTSGFSKSNNCSSVN
uniref:RING-type domain-containing protein n=1 Tax=Homalodisca liturata TaxID=320908 RepID=A0A1B6IZN7_9HEMI